MEKTNLYIPKKCKVGLQQRDGTYTGKLGYVIYHDGKVWRKENSWEGWRHKEGQMSSSWNHEKREYTKDPITGVEPIEFENVPTEGFVLNKNAGGYSSGWNHRQTYCRCHDPRGWEFEITIPNLLYILQECSSYKGKGLEGEFVYSWEGKDLVLLPISSPDYKECQVYTDLQSKKIGKKDLVEGCVYLTSNMEKLTYLGVHNVCENTYYVKTDIEAERYGANSKGTFEKKHVFRKFEDNLDHDYGDQYEFLKSFTRLKDKVSDDINPEFANYIDKLQKSEHYSEPDHLEVIPICKKNNRDVFEFGWNQTIYKFGEIKSILDFKNLERVLSKSKTEQDKWDVNVPILVKIGTYWGGDRFNTDLKLEGTFTEEEVREKYGILCRVYINGFKKLL